MTNQCYNSPNPLGREVICMKGGIYADPKYKERCPLCEGRFTHVELKGVICPDHPQCEAQHVVVRFENLCKCFTRDYKGAYRLLNGLRFQADRGQFDIRDWRKDAPLGFGNMVEKYLETKRFKPVAYKKYGERLRFAVNVWGNRNVKEINYGEIEALLLNLEGKGLSSKYRHDILWCLRMFWSWLAKLGVKGGGVKRDEVPDFPHVKYSMPFRTIISKEDQGRILARIRERTWDDNPRIYVACMFLSTYVNMRPNELRQIKEGDLELDLGRIKLTSTKEGHEKYVFLLDEDVELLRGFPRGFPNLHFFRHINGNGKAKPGQQFGASYLWNEWRKACQDLGIEGVPLYPGTRHSSEVAAREAGASPEEIWRAAGTRSNMARQRYLLVQGNELRKMYRSMKPTVGQNTIHTDFIRKSGVVGTEKTQAN